MYDFKVLKQKNFTFLNRKVLLENQKCACLHCYVIFESKDITCWADTVPLHSEMGDDDTTDYKKIGTAVCPYCCVDDVIGEKQGFEISGDFIEAYIKWEMNGYKD